MISIENLIIKLDLLIESLKSSSNASSTFSENIKSKLQTDTNTEDAINQLTTCYAITQYGNFTYAQDKILADIIRSILN